jgi:sugar lactone lactonase YvrE
MRIDRRMGRRDGSRGAWVLRLLLVVSLAAAVALTGQSQAGAEDDGDGSSIELVTGWGTEGILGERGGGNYEFSNPYGVAVGPYGNVYVADSSNSRIQRFTSDGTLDDNWGEQNDGTVGSYGTEAGKFRNPNGVAVGPNGSVYVADTGNHRIQRFTSDGDLDTNWGEQNDGTVGSYGTEAGKFAYPDGVTVDDSTGSVYVADTNNHRIQRFTSDGDLDTNWGEQNDGTVGSYGTEAGKFAYTRGVAVGPDGRVYVADRNNNRIQRFDSDGTLDDNWGEGGTVGSKGAGEGEFENPNGVAVGPDGSVYVADTNNSRIQKFIDTVPVSAEGNGAGGDCSDHVVFKAMIEEKGVGDDFGALIDCVALNQESLVDPGQLGYASVLPQGSAGSPGEVKVIFKTTNPIPPRGQVMVIFPEGFTATEDTSIEDAEYFDGLVSWPRFRGLEYLTNDENSKPRSFSLEPKYIYGKSAVVVIPNGVDSGKSVELTLTEVEHAKVSGKPSGAVIKTFTPEGALIDECAKDASVLYFSLPGRTKERIRFTQFIERFWKPIDVLAPDVGDECGIVYTSAKPGTLENLVFKLGDRVPVDDPDLEVPPTAAGSTGEVTVSFTTKNPVPAGGKVLVTFPADFEVGSDIEVVSDDLGSVECGGECLSGGRIVFISVAEAIEAGERVKLRLSDITNPSFTGDPQGGGIVTYDYHPDIWRGDWAGVVIDGGCESDIPGMLPDIWPKEAVCNETGIVTVDRITPGKLKVAENGVVPDNKTAGGTGYVTVTFTLDNPLPVNGAVAVTFPKGFALHCCGSLMEEKASQATFKNRDGSSIEGPYTVTDIKHGDDDKTTALFFRTEGVDVFEEGAEVIVELTNVRNPQQSGQTHNFEIRTSVGK